MSCIYIKDGNRLNEDQLKKDFSQSINNRVESESFFSINSTIYDPTFTKAVEYKKDLLRLLEKRIRSLGKQAKDNSGDIDLVSDLLNKKRITEERAALLERDIAIMNNKEAANLFKLAFYAQEDFKRLDYLLANDDSAEAIQEATKIVNFYIEIGRLDRYNPIIPKDGMVDSEGNIILKDSIRDILLDLKDKALIRKTKLEGISQTKAMNFINNLNKVQRMYGEDGKLSFDEVFYTEKGLKDANWVDMFVMDITNGIFSHNGLAPQAMMVILQEAIADATIFAKDAQRTVDKLKDDVERILREELNQGFKTLGFKGVSYDIFKAKDEDGNFKDAIVQRFSTKYFNMKKAQDRAFFNLYNIANSAKTETRRQKIMANANRKRGNWYRANTIIIDPSMLPEVISNSDYSSKELANEQEAEAYKKELIKVLGSELAYNEQVNIQLNKLKDYKANRASRINALIAENGVSQESELDAEHKKKLLYWEQYNDPFEGAKQFKDKRVRTLNKGQNNFKTTPNIKFGKKNREQIIVNLDTKNSSIVIEDRKISGAKKGDEIVFRNAAPKHSITYNANNGSFSSTAQISMRFNGTSWDVFQDTNMKFNQDIPKRSNSTSNDLGLYDKNFEIIEKHAPLLEFHQLLMTVQQKMEKVMPPEVRMKFGQNSLVTMKKGIFEILADTSMEPMERLFKAMGELYDRIRLSFGINPQSLTSQVPVDPITGIPEYTVNADFFKSNRTRINELRTIEEARMSVALKKDLSIQNIWDINKITDEAVQVLAENLGVYADTTTPQTKAKTIEALKKRLPSQDLSKFNLSRVLNSAIESQVVQEASFDLPKMIKLYSNLTAEYEARQVVKPALDLIKKHYQAIEKPEESNLGYGLSSNGEKVTNGVRTQANAQMDSWYQRAALGNYGSKAELGDTRIINKANIGDIGLKPGKLKDTLDKIRMPITGKILSKQDKIDRDKINNILENEDFKGDEQALVEQRNRLGKQFSGVAMFDSIFNFIRLKGLGWNLSSYVTNFMEGQTANMIIAARGDYFEPDLIYAANHIVKGSILKNLNKRIATPGSLKTRVFMDRWDVLQDASNELQKASTKSAFSRLGVLEPYEGTRRTEYLNQAPLMVAMMMDINIKDKDGNESTLWEAVDEEGKLIDGFNTEENINNWEKSQGQEYKDFKSKLTKLIVDAHGDYDQLRGNMASEYSTGKAFLMFKRWLSRQVYQRFASVGYTEPDADGNRERIFQDDLESEIKDFGGRYWSHTQASGMIHGAILGIGGLSLVGAGPLGLFLGSAVGALGGKLYGAKSNLSFLEDLAITGKNMAMTMMAIPINNVVGEAKIKVDSVDEMTGNYRITERDAKNMRANLVEMSITLAWIGFILGTKALLFDDEDEPDDPRRMVHNLLANRFMTLSSQAGMYLAPSDFYENTLGSMALMRFFDDVQKTGFYAAKAIEGRDILAAGPNAGESALYNQTLKTFFPAVGRDLTNILVRGNIPTGGFGTAMGGQFMPMHYDDWFDGAYTKAHRKVKRLRSERTIELQKDHSIPVKDITKILDKELPYPKKPKVSE